MNGGATRALSVQNGLTETRADFVAVHDAARPFVSQSVITAALNAAVTRAEYAGIFAKALPPELLPEINHIPDSSIPDVKMDDENAQAIYLLYRAGIVDGRDDYGRFDPNERIERAEIATILVRMMDPSARVGRPPLLGQ